jgi:hypothetical protein
VEQSIQQDGQLDESVRLLSERRLAIVKRLEEIGGGSYDVGYACDDPEARSLRRELREIRYQVGKLEQKRLRTGARALIESTVAVRDHDAVGHLEYEDEWSVDRGWRLPPRMERYPYKVALQKKDAVIRARILTFDEHGDRQTALAKALVFHCALPTGNGLEWAWQGERPGYPEVTFLVPLSGRGRQRFPSRDVIQRRIDQAQRVLWKGMNEAYHLSAMLDVVRDAFRGQ